MRIISPNVQMRKSGLREVKTIAKTEPLLFLLHYASPDCQEIHLSLFQGQTSNSQHCFQRMVEKGTFQEQRKEGSLRAPREELKSPRKHDSPVLENGGKIPFSSKLAN